MKTQINVKSGTVLLLFLLISLVGKSIYAQWIHDTKYNFKINIPSDWTKASHMDGTDKVYDFYSANQNAAVQLRVFKANPKVTVELLAQTYEQNMLPKRTKKQSLENHTSRNGIPGKIGLYSFKYNHNQVYMMVFYTVQRGNGYVLAAMVPSGTTQSDKEDMELKQVTQSFQIFGISAQQPVTPQKKTAGIGGIVSSMGKKSNYNTTPQQGAKRIAGKYRLVSRTDGNNSLNYWYLTLNRDGTFIDRHQLKGNPPYTTGEEGTWEVKGNKVTLYNKYHPAIYTVYSFDNNRLIRTTQSCVFTFKK